MKKNIVLSVILCMSFSCSTTNHPVLPNNKLGYISSEHAMEKMIDENGPVEFEVIKSVDWIGDMRGLINLSSKKAINLHNHDIPIDVYTYIIKHPRFGNFLIDTGVSEKLLKDPSSVGISWGVRKGMHLDKMIMRYSTEDIVKKLKGKIDGVFFTHLHLDHVSGIPAISNSTPLYIGPTESTEKYFINILVHQSTNGILQDKAPFSEWNFTKNTAGQFDGVIDIFGDGSVFAISTPGHTSGSTTYLVRTTKGPFLIIGDVCHTTWGWKNEVVPGYFTRDSERNLQSLLKVKSLAARHPKMIVRIGHQDLNKEYVF